MFEFCENCGGPIIPRYCPHCGALLDGHTAADLSDKCPEPGDVSICLYCSGIAIYTENALRLTSEQEWSDIMADPLTQKALAAAARMRAEGKIPPCR